MRNVIFAAVGVACGAVGGHHPAAAETYSYRATCTGSYSKQGDEQEDLTHEAGRPFDCDSIILSIPENGHLLVQFAKKTVAITPLGFAGNGLDYEMNANFATLPLGRIYLPHSSTPGRPEVIDGIQGFCFLDGKLNIRSLSEIDCSAKVEIGTQKLVFSIKAHALAIGQRVPGL